MQRAWKRIKKYSYLIVFVLPGLVVLGVRFGGAAAYLTPFVAFVLIPLLDLLVGEDRVNYTPEEEKALDAERYYRLVTYAFVPVYWAVLAYVVHGAIAGGWSLAEYAGNTWSMGILSGIGIVVAHELGHKASKLEKRLAKALLHPTFYGHFTQEHNLGHHLMVSTPEDPASSRFGESFWRFYPRTVDRHLPQEPRARAAAPRARREERLEPRATRRGATSSSRSSSPPPRTSPASSSRPKRPASSVSAPAPPRPSSSSSRPSSASRSSRSSTTSSTTASSAASSRTASTSASRRSTPGTATTSSRTASSTTCSATPTTTPGRRAATRRSATSPRRRSSPRATPG